MKGIRQRLRLIRRHGEEGAATAEYAIATMAAVGFAVVVAHSPNSVLTERSAAMSWS